MSDRESTPPKNSQELSSPNSTPDSKSSKSGLFENVSDWNKNWEEVLSRFKIKRISDLNGQIMSMELCLSRVKEIQNMPEIEDHIQDIISIVDRHFTVNMTNDVYVKFKGIEKEHRLAMKEDIDKCVLAIKVAAKNKNMEDKILSFVDDFKTYLNLVRKNVDNEMTAQDLFRTFADLVNLKFKSGNARKARTRDLETSKGKVLVRSEPDLRATLPSPVDWEEEKVLCLVEVKRRQDKKFNDLGVHSLRTHEVGTSSTLEMSEKLIGQVVGEMIVDFDHSTFHSDGQVVAFGVQGTAVQMFLLEMIPENLEFGRGPGPTTGYSHIYITPPYNLMLSAERISLLHVLAKFACYRSCLGSIYR